jgi:hypothetical protein
MLCFAFDASANPSLWIDEIQTYYRMASRHYNTAHDLIKAGNINQASVEAMWAQNALEVTRARHAQFMLLVETKGGDEKVPTFIGEWGEKISDLQTKLGGLLQLLPAPPNPDVHKTNGGRGPASENPQVVPSGGGGVVFYSMPGGFEFRIQERDGTEVLELGNRDTDEWALYDPAYVKLIAGDLAPADAENWAEAHSPQERLIIAAASLQALADRSLEIDLSGLAENLSLVSIPVGGALRAYLGTQEGVDAERLKLVENTLQERVNSVVPDYTAFLQDFTISGSSLPTSIGLVDQGKTLERAWENPVTRDYLSENETNFEHWVNRIPAVWAFETGDAGTLEVTPERPLEVLSGGRLVIDDAIVDLSDVREIRLEALAAPAE